MVKSQNALESDLMTVVANGNSVRRFEGGAFWVEMTDSQTQTSIPVRKSVFQTCMEFELVRLAGGKIHIER